MVDIGHPPLGVHTLRLSDLYRVEAGGSRARRRVPVHLLALVTSGRSSFSVDFTTYPCRPGGLLWARPGQFVRFPPRGVDATLVLFEPEFAYGVPSEPGSHACPGTYWQPTGDDEEAIVDAISQIEIDYLRIVAGAPVVTGVLRHAIAALLLRLAALDPVTATGANGTSGTATASATDTGTATGTGTADSEILARYRREIDLRFTQTRQVEQYARVLGCSVRTLTRASLAATGRTAKQLLDDRVALEAKRLLADDDLPVAQVGIQLGFLEPTNFGRFFVRTTGRSPGQFRAESRRAALAADRIPATMPPAQPLAAALAKAGSARG